jgi:hypothetical protein
VVTEVEGGITIVKEEIILAIEDVKKAVSVIIEDTRDYRIIIMIKVLIKFVRVVKEGVIVVIIANICSEML